MELRTTWGYVRQYMQCIAGVHLLLVALCTSAVAQEQHDTKGRKFWVAFLENFGSGGAFEVSDLRLYISSGTPTTVRITYNTSGQTAEIPISVANFPIEININDYFGNRTELEEVWSDGGNEISRKSFYIEADDDVTLYGVNIRNKSADAFLSLPDDVLTGRYIVLAYPNGQDCVGDPPCIYDKNSEFCIIATEDATTVRITPTAYMNGRSTLDEFTVVLDRGEVFFGQATLSLDQDVTGTQISANKPVSVFAGNQRTSIPKLIGNYRDHLVEQLPPLDAWGKTAILTPHFPVTPQSSNMAVARIVAAFNGTQVDVVNALGLSRFILQSGQSVEIDPLEAAYVSATQPIMVAQYEHSVDYVDQLLSQSGLGDPFMMLIPPPEQYDTAYTFQSVNHSEFLAHYITAIIPNVAIPSAQLDGQSIAGARYLPVPFTEFSYAHIKVLPGAHYIRCDSTFGLGVYGYGRASSYGYAGGTLFRQLVVDFQGPEVSAAPECRGVQGIAYDSRITDTGVDSCYVLDDTVNVDVEVLDFIPGSGTDTVRYRATLRDPYQDGVVSIKAIDAAGRSRIQRNSIPGFTLRAAGVVEENLYRDTLVSYNRLSFCRSVEIINYGKYPQQLSAVTLTPSDDPLLSVHADLPLTIFPGERKLVDICYGGWLGDSSLTIVIQIGDSCIGREVAEMTIVTRIDTTGPGIIREMNPCSNDYLLTFTEIPGLSSGIEIVEIDTLVNARAVVDPNADGLPANIVQMRLIPTDVRQDIIYQVALRDRARNVSVTRDTIAGFTVAVQQELNGNTLAIRLDREWNGDSILVRSTRCDSVILANYGLRPLAIGNIIMSGNRRYSIPPTQLPLVIPSGDIRKIAVCIEGGQAGVQLDTLMILDTCGRAEEVLMKTPIDFLQGVGADQCNVRISIQTGSATKRTFLTVATPNPVTGASARVDIGLTRDDPVYLDVLDVNGNPVLRVLEGTPLGAGISRLEFEITALKNGAYFCRLATGGGTMLIQKMIVSH